MDLGYLDTLASLYRREADAGIDLKLERVKAVAAALGSPQRSFGVIHVAGTNGKGSTAAAAAAVLKQAGYRVGLYTSPHLTSFRERIRISGEMISSAEVVEGVAEIDGLARAVLPDAISLTFFEVTTLLAFLTFARRGVEIAVIEVGLGGRLDATNIVEPEVAVIAQVALDHEKFLGSDLELVAGEKAAIVKRGRPTVTALQEQRVLRVIAETAAARSSSLFMPGRDFSVEPEGVGGLTFRGSRWLLKGLRSSLHGGFHRDNVGLALAALEAIGSDYPVDEEAVRGGLSDLRWPGRLQVVSRRPRVILDGAHNPAAASALVAELDRMTGVGRFFLLFAAMKDKRWQAMLSTLVPRAQAVMLTRAAGERGAAAERMAHCIREMGCEKTELMVEPDPIDALGRLLGLVRPHETIVVAGSLRLVGQVLPKFDDEFANLQASEEGISRRLPVG